MSKSAQSRVVKAVHGLQQLQPDPEFEVGMAEYLRQQYSNNGLIELYARFAVGEGSLDVLMRRIIWRSLARRFGHGIHISGV